MTNKELFEVGRQLDKYPIDFNPFTGDDEKNGGFEYIFLHENMVYAVLTDITGSVVEPYEEPDIVSDDGKTFVEQLNYTSSFDPYSESFGTEWLESEDW